MNVRDNDLGMHRIHRRAAPRYNHGIFDDGPMMHYHHPHIPRTVPPPPPTYYAPPPTRANAYPVLNDGTFYDNFSNMFMFPRWMKRVLGRFGVPNERSLENLRGNIDGSNLHEVWEQFLESNEMKRILKASKPRQLPTEATAWVRPLRTAIRLWKELESVSVEATPIVYPVLCLLFKGTHLMQKYGKGGRKRLLHQDASEGLVRACLLVTSVECPHGFLKQLLEKHPEQLEERLDGKTPLWVLLENRQEDVYRYRYGPGIYPDLLATMVEANPNVASITYKNRYPLHQACQRGYVWRNGVEMLVKAAPQAMQASANAPGVLHPIMEVGLAHAEARASRQAAADEDMFSHYHTACHRSYYHHSQQMARAERDAIVTDTLFELLMMDPTVVSNFTAQKGKLAIEHRSTTVGSLMIGGPSFLW